MRKKKKEQEHQTATDCFGSKYLMKSNVPKKYSYGV